MWNWYRHGESVRGTCIGGIWGPYGKHGMVWPTILVVCNPDQEQTTFSGYAEEAGLEERNLSCWTGCEVLECADILPIMCAVLFKSEARPLGKLWCNS